MTDFLNRIAAKGARPIAREVTLFGETDTVYFRLLTAAQRHSLLEGQSFAVKKGDAPTITIDLGQTEHEKQRLVHFCVCDEQGRPAYKTLEEVRKLASPILEELSAHARAVNSQVYGGKDDGLDDAGES